MGELSNFLLFTFIYITFIRCYGCTLPKNPPKGRWDCDVLKNGNTVCMLQCEVSIDTLGVKNEYLTIIN